MTNEFGSQDFRRRMERLEASIEEFERLPDANLRARVREIVRALLDLHAEGLERILDRVAQIGDVGLAVIDELAQDELINGLLLLHGLHPLDLEARIRQAMDKVRPQLRSHGGNVEIVGITATALRLRLEGNCHGCPSSAATIKTLIEDAVYQFAPEVQKIEVDESASPSASSSNNGQVHANGRPLISLPLRQLEGVE
jgi:Fe-S cluster biogenesis protein NfuA